MFDPQDKLRIEVYPQDNSLVLIPYRIGEDGQRTVQGLSHYAMYGWPGKVIGARRVQNHYIAPFSDETVRAIQEWSPESVEWQGEALRLTAVRRALSLHQREELASLISQYKDTGEIPAQAAAIPDPEGVQLKPFQKLGAYIVKESEFFGIWFEQGCGKTATMLAGMAESAKDRENKETPLKVLGLIPPNLLLNWERETGKFLTVPATVHSVPNGAPTRRMLSILEKGAESQSSGHDVFLTLISYDSVGSLINGLKFVPWDIIFVDESHGLKNMATNRAKTIVEELAYGFPNAKKFTLTGTPINNTLADLYGQFEFQSRGLSGHSDFTSFKDAYTNVVALGKGRKVEIAGKNANIGARLTQKIATNAFVVKKKDVLSELPDKMFSVRGVEMTDEQGRAYDTLRTQLVLQHETYEGKSLTVNHVLTQLLRLTQITSGFVSYDPEIDETGCPISDRQLEYFADNPKLAELVNIIEEMEPEEKAVVWVTHQPMYDRIIDNIFLSGNGVVEYTGRVPTADRQHAVDQFNNNPLVRFMVANPRSAGTGLNLLGYNVADPGDTNCAKHINFSLNWSWAGRAQSIDRSHRQGTRVPLEIIDLIVPHSIDSAILKVLEQKGRLADSVTSIDVKEVLQLLKGKLI